MAPVMSHFPLLLLLLLLLGWGPFEVPVFTGQVDFTCLRAVLLLLLRCYAPQLPMAPVMSHALLNLTVLL